MGGLKPPLPPLFLPPWTGGRAKYSGECGGFRAEQLEELVQELGSVFADGATGTTDVVTMKIDTKDADLIAQPLHIPSL